MSFSFICAAKDFRSTCVPHLLACLSHTRTAQKKKTIFLFFFLGIFFAVVCSVASASIHFSVRILFVAISRCPFECQFHFTQHRHASKVEKRRERKKKTKKNDRTVLPQPKVNKQRKRRRKSKNKLNKKRRDKCYLRHFHYILAHQFQTAQFIWFLFVFPVSLFSFSRRTSHDCSVLISIFHFSLSPLSLFSSSSFRHTCIERSSSIIGYV